MSTNGWGEYQKLVLNELERLNEQQEKINVKIDKLAIEIATLRVKAGMWGALAGTVPALVTFLFMYFKHG